MHLCVVCVCVCVCVSHSICPAVYDPMDSSPPGSSVHGILQARILEWVVINLFQRIFLTPGIEPKASVLQADSLPSEPPGKPKCVLNLI